MRVARVEMGWDFLIRIMHGHELTKLVSTLPDDARALSVDIDAGRRLLYLYVESATFDEVPEGYVIPAFNPTFTVSVTEMSMLAELVSTKHDEVLEENRDLRQRLWLAGVDPDA